VRKKFKENKAVGWEIRDLNLGQCGLIGVDWLGVDVLAGKQEDSVCVLRLKKCTKWRRTLQNGDKLYKMATNSTKWRRTLQNGDKLYKMTTNFTKWQRTLQNGNELYKMTTNFTKWRQNLQNCIKMSIKYWKLVKNIQNESFRTPLNTKTFSKHQQTRSQSPISHQIREDNQRLQLIWPDAWNNTA